MEYPIEPNAPDPTWSDSLVDVLKRSLFSKDKGEAEALDLPEQPSDPSIQWSDVGDIWENIRKGTWSRGVDYAAKPFEWLTGRDLSGDIGVPEYEDWDTEYRDRFEQGPYGWLTHADKASHVTGGVGAALAYLAAMRVPGVKEVASTAYPSVRYISDLVKMNRAMRLKKMLDTGVPSKGGIWNAVKDFAKIGGQSIGRPFRHLLQYKKRRKKEFDQIDPKIYEKVPGKPGGFPVSEKLYSLPERNLAKYSGIKYGAIGASDVARSLVREARADEIDIDVPRGIETVRPAGMPAHLTYGG